MRKQLHASSYLQTRANHVHVIMNFQYEMILDPHTTLSATYQSVQSVNVVVHAGIHGMKTRDFFVIPTNLHLIGDSAR